MALRINLYSYFVTFAKITLPMVAIGLLASLFLFANGSNEATSIPYSDVELEEIIMGQRLAAPNYRSVLTDGSALSVNAVHTQPDAEIKGRINGEEIIARVSEKSGVRTVLTAPEGYFNENNHTATTLGGTLIRRSDGFQAITEGITVEIEENAVRSHGRIEIRGPRVFLEAGQAHLNQGASGPGSEVMVFSEGVKLIYGPRPIP